MKAEVWSGCSEAKMSPKPNEKPISREEWEAVLRERMANAQAQYYTVSEECKRLMAISQDAQRPDSSAALSQALALRRSQLRNFMAVLRQFTDFAVSGKL